MSLQTVEDPPRAASQPRERALADRLKPHLDVERRFAETGRTFRKNRFQLWYRQQIEPRLLKMGLQATGLYRRGVENALNPVTRKIRLPFAGLPAAFDGFQILHLSDFHINGNEALTQRLTALLPGLAPDLCVFTGDYRFDIFGPCGAIYPLMQSIVSSISSKHGIIGILGNHDAAEIALALEDMGVRMLINDAAEISRGSESIWVAGIDDSFDYRCDDLDGALSGVPRAAFKLLLAHTPDLYAEAANRGVDLYLCGHTHAGQIRLPLLGSLRHNSKTGRAYSYGRWKHGGMEGYTTAGVGCSALRVRYNCPPEVVLIELLRDC